MKIPDSVYVHPKALVESEDIGQGTRIWAFAHIRKGVHIGTDCNIGDYVMVDGYVGNRVTLKDYCAIGLGIHIEDDVFIGPGAMTTNDPAPRSPRMAGVPEVTERYANMDNWLAETRICRGATVGAKVVIGPGVTIGAYAMVAAGTLVFEDVSPHRLVAGRAGRAIGWVCFCGKRLSQSQEQLWACECGRKFSRTDEGEFMLQE